MVIKVSKKAVIIIGAPVNNMGSQALVRGVTKNIKSEYPDATVVVAATEKGFDKSLDLPGVDKYIQRYSIERGKINYLRIVKLLRKKILRQKIDDNRYILFHLLRECNEADIIIIIGGDNYDKSYGSLSYMRETTSYIEEFGLDRTVLLNCSFSKEDLTEAVISDIGRFKYITARDSISFENLRRALPKNNIKFYPDVAFGMEAQETELPLGWEAGNMIGINASSLIGDGRYGCSEEEVLNAYKHLCDYILEYTTLKICFIPHVKRNADLSVLSKLYDGIQNKERAIIISHENYNAAQKKYIISNCRMFVGARTHATIAAYSSCVPTLVVGYSVKSVGIATDLFGTDAGYVIPVEKLVNPEVFVDTFKEFVKKEDEIRRQLALVIPSYIQKSYKVRELIREILR